MEMYAAFLITLAASSAAASDQDWHPAVDQSLLRQIRKNSPKGLMSISSGAPVTDLQVNGTLNKSLILNAYYMDVITNHVRERIIERAVHTKGAGAFGYFEVTHNISHICMAKLFNKIGKRTAVAVRFSSATAERGGNELARGAQGFAVKFYTEDGNFDLPCINFEVFFVQKPSDFFKFAPALKKDPALYVHNPMLVWDKILEHPESVNMFLRLFGDGGIPKSYQHMPGYNIHTLQVVNKHGKRHFVRFTILPDAGIKNLKNEEAAKISLMDPDHYTRTLYDSIKKGDYPSWSVCMQVVTEADVQRCGWDLFNPTRVLPESEFPLLPVGKIVLNRNPKNYFAEVELLRFSPANLVKGVDGGPDKLYEARRYAYTDAALHRLGPDADKIPVNCPLHAFNGYSDPTNEYTDYRPTQKSGLLKIKEKDSLNFDEAADYYENKISEDEKIRLHENIILMLKPAKPAVQQKVIELFTTIHPKLGTKLQEGLTLS